MSMVAHQVECVSSVAAFFAKMIVFQIILTPLRQDIRAIRCESTQPGNPLSAYSTVFNFASSRCTGVCTNLSCRAVLPKSMKKKKCSEPPVILPYSLQYHQMSNHGQGNARILEPKAQWVKWFA
jgi:hypothetical protein